jgi:hypothetical protein
MKDEALKLALEALEANQPVNYCLNSKGEKFPMLSKDPFKFERNAEAITAIKQALAQPAPVQEPVAVTYKEVADTMNALWGGTLEQVQIAMELANKKLYTTPPAAQPAPVQEPLTWLKTIETPGGFGKFVEAKPNEKGAKPVYLTPPAAPVQDLPFGVGGGLVAIKTLLSRDPCVHANTAIEMIDAILKEHPAAQRQWVGLSQDELDAMFSNTIKGKKLVNWVARAIEAKLKEKNT